MVRRAPVARTIDEIHLVAFLHVVMRPAGLLAEPHVMKHRSAAAVHQHDGEGVTHLRRNQILNVHLPGDDGAVGHLLRFRANPEVALVLELHGRRIALARRAARRRRLRAVGRHVLHNPVRDGLEGLAVVLLEHHHVPVALDAVVDQPQLFGLHDAGLLQIRNRTRIARRCERCIGRHDDDWNVAQVLEFPRRFGLQHVGLHAGLGRFDANGFDLGGI